MREARITAIRTSKVRSKNGKRFYVSWVDASGARDQSLRARPELARAHKVGDVIVVYIDPKTGRGWWQKQL